MVREGGLQQQMAVVPTDRSKDLTAVSIRSTRSAQLGAVL